MFAGENKGELIKAFVKAQPNFEVPKRSKTAKVQTRSGGNYEYKYSTLDELIAATRPALKDQGLACFNNVTMPAQNVVTVTCVLMHGESGQVHESDPLIFQVDGSPQATGAAITYGRRYSMSALLGVAAEDDTDAPNHGAPQQGNQQQQARGGRGGKQQQPQTNTGGKQQQAQPEEIPAEEIAEDQANKDQAITPAQLERLQRIVKGAGVKGRAMKAWLNGQNIAEAAAIKRGQYQQIVTDVQGGKVPALPSEAAK